MQTITMINFKFGLSSNLIIIVNHDYPEKKNDETASKIDADAACSPYNIDLALTIYLK